MGKPEHLRETSDEWFWPQVKLGTTCWPWRGPTEKGYGRLVVQGKKTRAHRVAFWLVTGRWPTPFGLHKCGNRLCCRVDPEHVYEGTPLQNTKDRREAGVSTHPGNLTADQVREIRRRYERGQGSPRPRPGNSERLAAEFGIKAHNVRDIAAGRTYKGVKP